jgi:hypothetical protein
VIISIYQTRKNQRGSPMYLALYGNAT